MWPSGVLGHTGETDLSEVMASLWATRWDVDVQGDGGDGAGWVSREASWRGWLMHEQGRARQREATPGRGETFPPSSIRRQAERKQGHKT